ncbi:MAG: hypothetical protein LH615_09045 [Ferruginibacter sp.]|nr:hypothetical protein [Ferruginibacter sp.]
MKKNYPRFLFSFLLICIIGSVNAQSREFENVMKIELKNTTTIKNNNQIVGYAFFYKLEKMKKAALYRLEILDENLKSIGSNEFEGSKELELMSSTYESGMLMLAFSDAKKTDDYEKFVKVFDLKGKEKGLVPYDPDKVKKGMFGAAIAEQMSEYYNGYSNVEGKGFVCVYQSKAKVGGADIQFVDLNGKLKWEKNISADKGDRMDLYLTASTPNAIIFFCSERSGVMEKDSKNFLIGLDPTTGKELYKKSMEVKDLAIEPMFFKQDESGKTKMISILSHEEDKFYSAKPIGFNIIDLNDKTGEFTQQKNFTYENDLSKVLDMKSESKSEEGYLKIHDVMLMPDGSKVMVGEFYRRTISVLGGAMKVLSRGTNSAAASQISIGDAFLLRIDKNNNPTALEKIEKSVDRVPLPQDGLPLGLVQRWLGLEGWFGYLYSDEISSTKKTVLFTGEFEGDKYGTSAITFDEKKGYKVKRFNIEKEKKERVYLRRGKPGHVLVTKYNAKTKILKVNLERVD